MSVVAVSGVSGALGRRVAALLEADPDVERIVGIDRRPPSGRPGKLAFVHADLAHDDLKPLLHGVRHVLHLAFDDGPEAADDTWAAEEVDATRRLLDAAGGAGVDHVVVLSSATVYGAWPDNPVPLTEDAPIRPTPGFACAARRAEVERLVAEWKDAHPGTTATVLRPAVALAEREGTWMARALRAAAGIRAGDDPPAQFLHLDDLASAVAIARAARLDGPFNVAPDGWIPGERVRALAGPRPRIRLTERAASRVASGAWSLRVGPIPPGLLAYTLHPWVVANDRLRAAGWQARHSNEEAFVAGHEASPWSDLSPKRRQELALGGAGALVAGVAAGVTMFLRRRTR